MQLQPLSFFTVGIPLSGGSTGVTVQAEQLALVNCTGNENSTSSCNITRTALTRTGNQQARVRCFSQKEGEYIVKKCTYYTLHWIFR